MVAKTAILRLIPVDIILDFGASKVSLMNSREGDEPHNGSIEDGLTIKPEPAPLASDGTRKSLSVELESLSPEKEVLSKAQKSPAAVKSSMVVSMSNDETTLNGAPGVTTIDAERTAEDSKIKKRPRSPSPLQGTNPTLQQQEEEGMLIKRSRVLAFSPSTKPSSQNLVFRPQPLGKTMRAFSSRSIPADHVTDILADAEEDHPTLGSAAVPPLCKSKGPQPSVTSTSDANPGIFDDADEDDTFDFAVHQNSSPAPSLLRSSPPRSLRPDLVAAILGTPPKPVPAQTTSGASGDTQERKRKKPVKPIKKVLHAAREQEAADKAIRGKIDLARVLPEEDCYFLGKERMLPS